MTLRILINSKFFSKFLDHAPFGSGFLAIINTFFAQNPFSCRSGPFAYQIIPLFSDVGWAPFKCARQNNSKLNSKHVNTNKTTFEFSSLIRNMRIRKNRKTQTRLSEPKRTKINRQFRDDH